jgi:hypothetical protein
MESTIFVLKYNLRETTVVFNISKSLQTTLAVEAHLAEGRFLTEGPKLRKKKNI